MARYFFHLYDTKSKNLVRDSEGAVFSSFNNAKNETIALARDIAALGIDRSTWQVLVIDEDGHQVLRVSLSKVQARKFRPWIDLAHRIVTYQPRLRSGVFTCLLTAAVLVMVGHGAGG
jgi:hypothetical protein